MTALIVSLKNSRNYNVDSLLLAGASVDIQDNNGMAALWSELKYGHVSNVDALITAGGSVDIQDKDGCTALIYASDNGHVAILKSLLQSPVLSLISSPVLSLTVNGVDPTPATCENTPSAAKINNYIIIIKLKLNVIHVIHVIHELKLCYRLFCNV